MKLAIPLVVVVVLLLAVAAEAAASGRPRVPRRPRAAQSLATPSQDPLHPVDLRRVSCEFSLPPVNLPLVAQESYSPALSCLGVNVGFRTKGGFYYVVGPFEAQGLLIADTFWDVPPVGVLNACYDSQISVFAIETGTPGACIGNFDDRAFGAAGFCATMAFRISAEDVELQRKFLLMFGNFDPNVPSGYRGGYSFTMAYTCMNIPLLGTCPSVVVSQKTLPPNGKMADMSITALPLGVGKPQPALRIMGIQQNEPVPAVKNGRPKATAAYNTTFNSGGTVDFQLAADRAGFNTGGRTYMVSYEVRTAEGSCTGMTAVCVPHHEGAVCTDDGVTRYDSVPLCM